MTIKAGGKLRQMYLIDRKKLKGVVKNITKSMFVFIAIPFFTSACQSADYGNNFTFAENTSQSNTETIQLPKNNELTWAWSIKADTYSELLFVDDDLIAAKEPDGQYVIVNINGESVISYRYSSVSSFENGVALVKANGKCFFVNKKGENVFNESFEYACSFSNGFAAVKKDGLWGFLDNTGKIAIINQFDEVNKFNENIVAVMKNNKWGFIDNTGKVISDFQFDSINDFHNGYAAVSKAGKWGFINKSGKFIVDCEFDDVKNFSDGFAAVRKDKKWGFIDTSGKLCIALKYDDVGNFSEDKASVKLYQDDIDEWAYIDNSGNIVIDFFPYDAAKDQLFCVGEFHNGLAIVSKTLLSVIDSNGNNVFLGGSSKFFISSTTYNKEFDVIPAYVYLDDDMKIKKYGLMGLNGNLKLEPIFDYINSINGNYVVVECIVNNEKKVGLIRIDEQY